MQITRKSILTRKIVTKEIDVDPELLAKYEKGEAGLIQEVFPRLSASDREFIKTGITEEEWEMLREPDE